MFYKKVKSFIILHISKEKASILLHDMIVHVKNEDFK